MLEVGTAVRSFALRACARPWRLWHEPHAGQRIHCSGLTRSSLQHRGHRVDRGDVIDLGPQRAGKADVAPLGEYKLVSDG